jgi:hypothetical protein
MRVLSEKFGWLATAMLGSLRNSSPRDLAISSRQLVNGIGANSKVELERQRRTSPP